MCDAGRPRPAASGWGRPPSALTAPWGLRPFPRGQRAVRSAGACWAPGSLASCSAPPSRPPLAVWRPSWQAPVRAGPSPTRPWVSTRARPAVCWLASGGGGSGGRTGPNGPRPRQLCGDRPVGVHGPLSPSVKWKAHVHDQQDGKCGPRWLGAQSSKAAGGFPASRPRALAQRPRPAVRGTGGGV